MIKTVDLPVTFTQSSYDALFAIRNLHAEELLTNARDEFMKSRIAAENELDDALRGGYTLICDPVVFTASDGTHVLYTLYRADGGNKDD